MREHFDLIFFLIIAGVSLLNILFKKSKANRKKQSEDRTKINKRPAVIQERDTLFQRGKSSNQSSQTLKRNSETENRPARNRAGDLLKNSERERTRQAPEPTWNAPREKQQRPAEQEFKSSEEAWPQGEKKEQKQEEKRDIISKMAEELGLYFPQDGSPLPDSAYEKPIPPETFDEMQEERALTRPSPIKKPRERSRREERTKKQIQPIIEASAPVPILNLNALEDGLWWRLVLETPPSLHLLRGSQKYRKHHE